MMNLNAMPMGSSWILKISNWGIPCDEPGAALADH